MYQEDKMPKHGGLDHTASVLKKGYNFIAETADHLNTDVFETRLMGQRMYCMRGSEAAELFYDESKFQRSGAAPLPVRKTLFGEGGVQGLDDHEHRHRKAMFMQLRDHMSEATLRESFVRHLEAAAADWQTQGDIVLYDEIKIVLTRFVCEWVGVPLPEDEVHKRTEQLASLFELAGETNLKHFKAWRARSKAEDWIEELVSEAREHPAEANQHSPFALFCWHRDPDGALLDKHSVAVEVLNLLRPTVANAIWVVFAAKAIADHPHCLDPIRNGDTDACKDFSEEVRRFYPFFPFLVAKVRHNFAWKEYQFAEGTLTLLDIYGTHHSPREWQEPDRFMPERYQHEAITPYNFIPQGGGTYHDTHRCAGEWVTKIVLEHSVDFLVNRLSYELPKQDLSYSMSEIPSMPASGVKMSNIRLNLS